MEACALAGRIGKSVHVAEVAERRAARERATRLVAPLFAGPLPRIVRAMLVTGRSFLGASTVPDALLHGAPASPGIATGAVRIIRDLAGRRSPATRGNSRGAPDDARMD